METKELLQERGGTHGPFSENARLAQSLEDIIRTSRNYPDMDPVIREALHMIVHKIARACSGDAYFYDHWADLAGYAKLAENHCHKLRVDRPLNTERE